MPPFPESIQIHLSGYATTGENHRTSSMAKVLLFQKPGAPDLFLKIDRAGLLSREKMAMDWLADKLPAPRVLAHCQTDPVEYLLTVRLPGQPAFDTRDKPRVIRLLAEGLRTIHSLAPDHCPLPDYSAEHLLATAEHNIATGSATPQSLAQRGDPRTPDQALSEALALRPERETRAFTHGDYCLPNILIHNGALSGFIDWGSAGTGDPHRDFISAEYSIRRNFGEVWIAPFFDAYGRHLLDERRLAFYRAIYDLT